MSSLTAADKLYLEKILEMDGGYVLKFSDATFKQLFNRYSVDIHGDRYQNQQMVSGFKPDEHTAKVCFQVLKAALADVVGDR